MMLPTRGNSCRENGTPSACAAAGSATSPVAGTAGAASASGMCAILRSSESSSRDDGSSGGSLSMGRLTHAWPLALASYPRKSREAMDESKLRSLHAQAQYDQATRELLVAYGREIFGFMRARMRNEDHAKEAYSQFAVNVWRGMPGFRGQCPFRAWAYAI